MWQQQYNSNTKMLQLLVSKQTKQKQINNFMFPTFKSHALKLINTYFRFKPCEKKNFYKNILILQATTLLLFFYNNISFEIS